MASSVFPILHFRDTPQKAASQPWKKLAFVIPSQKPASELLKRGDSWTWRVLHGWRPTEVVQRLENYIQIQISALEWLGPACLWEVTKTEILSTLQRVQSSAQPLKSGGCSWRSLVTPLRSPNGLCASGGRSHPTPWFKTYPLPSLTQFYSEADSGFPIALYFPFSEDTSSSVWNTKKCRQVSATCHHSWHKGFFYLVHRFGWGGWAELKSPERILGIGRGGYFKESPGLAPKSMKPTAFIITHNNIPSLTAKLHFMIHCIEPYAGRCCGLELWPKQTQKKQQ